MRIFLLASCVSISCMGMTIRQDILRTSSALSQAKVIYDKERFIVDDHGEQQAIQRHNMSKDLRSLSNEQIQTLLSKKDALLYLRTLSDKSYALELHGKLKGGTGPTTAFIGGLLVKTICWAGVMVGASLVYKGSERATRGDRTAAAGTTFVAVGGGIGAAGGWSGVAGGIEAIGNSATLAILAIPIPLP